ncbi:isochorismatase family protein [Rhizomonospora bruguierae]|uniref:isochorismatase family protein n=1 Tax=Rhizomonospora bruguierae TaxID=1581705 RepID=UPI001BD0C8A7|nr:isochorismatase family protein [Micromonospora sp. NBRC 107566]
MAGIPTITPYALPTADSLPANTADWRIDPRRAVLLVHDMQRYFLRPIPAVEPGRAMVSNVRRLRAECIAHKIPVGYTAQPGDMDDRQRGLLKDFWGPGMRVDPVDRQIIDELSPGPADWLFTKWRYSAFVRSDLLDRMRRDGRDQIVVCGVYAHVGVLATAVDAFSNDIQPFLVADAVADFSERFHRMALEYAALRCAFVASTAQIVDQLGPTGDPIGAGVPAGRRALR